MSQPVAHAQGRYSYDVVVYGGTPAGVIAARAAACQGQRTALVVPGKRLGGVVSGGLTRTDFGRQETVGGMSREFFVRVGRRYQKDIAWFFEPHVAEEVFWEMARDAGVDIFQNHRLKEADGVRRARQRIWAVIAENGARFSAKVFVDCSYEGDLMAQAGVSYTWGRESVSDYGEDLAGVRPKDRNHQFDFAVPARDEEGRLLPEVGEQKRGDIGEGDRKVQAYNFRMCLSDDPANRVPFPKPEGYDPSRYRVLGLWLNGMAEQKGRAPHLDEALLPAEMPNRKWDFNNRGAFSTDYIGKSWEYPNASYARRAEIWREHEDYTKGLFYFLANDPSVPAELQAEINRFGLAADEFADNGHFPTQLYIREARRMAGDFVMTQADIQTELTKPDTIGMGSYGSDSHNVQRYEQADGTVQNEGNMEVPVQPYEIPYRVLLPRRQEAENLLVPVCLSASHVAYSTLRMEPVYMIIGQAAGVAADLAIRNRCAVQQIDTGELRRRLKEQGAVLSCPR
ncbi:MAG: FAD-dependent oxidoreductase [Armatimonadetes bacterium]|nr:FAD-dependent oxidoreductase [Armatimonadota bacterium]